MFTQRQTRILAIIAMLVTIVIYQHLLETDRPFCEVPDLNLMYQIQNNKKRTEEIAYDKYLDAEPVNNIFDTFNVTRSVMCNNKAKIIIMVKSFPDNIRQRMAIRKTWGSCRKQDVQLIYLIGSVTHTSGNLMETEIQEFGDILRGSFEDNYYNNIYKTVMAYDWVSSKCKGDRYVYFSDDDFFINIPKLVAFAENNLAITHSIMIGYRQCNQSPYRQKLLSKYYVTYEEFPYSIYPPFLSAGAVLTNINTVRKLRNTFPFVRIIHLDDIYIAVVAHLLRIKLIHEEKIVIHKPRPWSWHLHILNNVISWHNFDAIHLNTAWRIFIRSNKCI